MPTRTPTSQARLWSSAALILGLLAAPVLAQDKPKDHGDAPGASYSPSMTTLGQLNLEIPGRKPDDPVITDEEFARASTIYFERCAGCHGVLRKGATGKPLTPEITLERGTEYLKTFIKYGSPGGMPNWGTSGDMTDAEVDLMARYVQQEPPTPPEFGMEAMKKTWKVIVPPEKRRIGIVPQEGALFPHLDVSANVAFGLPRADSASRVAEVLEMVGMSDYAHARPHELSGGQQQRVALARALAPRPEVILLDEPFTALDAALRVRLRAEVRELLRGLGTTALLITHDQEEALSTADLVAVLRDGRIVQVGTPLEVYDVPADLDVARFVGDAVELPAVATGGRVACALGDIPMHADTSVEGDAVVVLRPEQLVLSCPVEPNGGVPGGGVVRETSYHGHDSLLRVELADGTLIPVRVPGGTPPPRPGDAVVVSVTGPGRVYSP